MFTYYLLILTSISLEVGCYHQAMGSWLLILLLGLSILLLPYCKTFNLETILSHNNYIMLYKVSLWVPFGDTLWTACLNHRSTQIEAEPVPWNIVAEYGHVHIFIIITIIIIIIIMWFSQSFFGGGSPADDQLGRLLVVISEVLCGALIWIREDEKSYRHSFLSWWVTSKNAQHHRNRFTGKQMDSNEGESVVPLKDLRNISDKPHLRQCYERKQATE